MMRRHTVRVCATCRRAGTAERQDVRDAGGSEAQHRGGRKRADAVRIGARLCDRTRR